jgi:hypothetical protein
MSCNVAGVEAMFLLPNVEEARDLVSGQGLTGEIDAVWLDLSLSDNHFLPGTFLPLGPLFLGRAVFWNGLLPANLHYYRLNALVGDRWVQIGAGTFETPDCDVVTRIACNWSADGSLAFTNIVRFNLGPWRPRGGGPGPDKDNPVEYLDLVLWYDFFPQTTLVGIPVRAPTVLDVTVLPGIRHFYRRNSLAADGYWYAQWHGKFLSLRCDNLAHSTIPTDLP